MCKIKMSMLYFVVLIVFSSFFVSRRVVCGLDGRAVVVSVSIQPVA